MLIGIAVFSAVFAIILLLSMSFDSSGVQARKQTQQRLDSISLAAGRAPEDENISFLREELFSAAPWMDRWLQGMDLFSGLSRLLNQADTKWTVMQTLVASLASAVVVGIAAFLRTDAILFALLLSVAGGASPFLYILYKRSQR